MTAQGALLLPTITSAFEGIAAATAGIGGAGMDAADEDDEAAAARRDAAAVRAITVLVVTTPGALLIAYPTAMVAAALPQTSRAISRPHLSPRRPSASRSTYS